MVEAHNLVKRFGDFVAVDGVDFTITKGESFGFLGPNGAGKTSTMRMISCISPISSGTLRVLGQDPVTQGAAIRARMGLVPQEDSLDLELTVLDNLMIYGRYFDMPRKVIRARADQLLEGLLVLARAQHGALPGPAVLQLDYVLSAALAARHDAITARNLTVQYVTGSDGIWVEGSQPLLRRIADNVISNAVSHNRHGGWIRVTTTAGDGAARLIIENGGDVLDPAQVAGLAQPFRRLGADRTGSDDGAGLGLSIVAAIIEAHRGSLDLHARPGGGLTVTITLPLAPRAATVTGPQAAVPA